MVVKLAVFCELFLLMVFFVSTNAQPKRIIESQKVDFCEIAKDPKRFADKQVTFISTFVGGFMQHDLLLDESCSRISVVPTFDLIDDGVPKIMKEIKSGLVSNDEGFSYSGKFMFTGYLRKNPVAGGPPVKGVLQDYSFVIEGAKPTAK